MSSDRKTRQFERAHEDCKAPWPRGAWIETLRDTRPRWFLVTITGSGKALRMEIRHCPQCGQRAKGAE